MLLKVCKGIGCSEVWVVCVHTLSLALFLPNPGVLGAH